MTGVPAPVEVSTLFERFVISNAKSSRQPFFLEQRNGEWVIEDWRGQCVYRIDQRNTLLLLQPNRAPNEPTRQRALLSCRAARESSLNHLTKDEWALVTGIGLVLAFWAFIWLVTRH